MPRPEINDYTFYKIININNDVDLCYVGSSCNMKQRRHAHRNACNNNTHPSHNCKVYTTIREYGGWDEFKIVEVGHREQITLRQSHQIEEEYRLGLKANLNELRCFRTDEEWKEQKKIIGIEWRKDNKQYSIDYNKYYNKIIVVCECGCEIRKHHLSRHLKTQKHINLMNAKTD